MHCLTMIAVTCSQCAHFEPSQLNPAQGAGMCGVLVDWYERHKEASKKPSPAAIKHVYQELGGTFGEASAICWPKSERDRCKRFKGLLSG